MATLTKHLSKKQSRAPTAPDSVASAPDSTSASPSIESDSVKFKPIERKPFGRSTIRREPTDFNPSDFDPSDFDFVELMARSHFSFLQGASSPEELIQAAQEYGYQGLALCDLNGLYGIARGYKAAGAQKEFSYHIGAELTLPQGNLVLLPMSKRGYSNLCRLITEMKQTAPKTFSTLTDDNVFFLNQDLLVFLPPPWDPMRLEKYRSVFKDRLYLPVWKDLTWESRVYYEQALHLEQAGYSLFATQRPFFHQRTRKKLFDALCCLYHNKKLKDAKLILGQNDEHHLHSKSTLKNRWQDRPDLLSKTRAISDRLKFSLKEIRYRYPLSSLPAGKSSIEHLATLCRQGLNKRFPDGASERIQSLLKKELGLIQELGYEDYFLTLHEICAFAREKNILHQGRGSAANSVVCFLLELTSVHPDKINMLFERFISKERAEPPDIDIDFEHERREEVLQHIYQKYGHQRAAMVSNVICYRSRMALRDICRVLDVSEESVSRLVRAMGREGLSGLKKDPSLFNKIGLSQQISGDILSLAYELHGTPRHLGIHSGGFVISEGCLIDEVPIEKASMQGRSVVQWNKDDVETLGLMKVDLLSLGMLTALRKSLNLLKEKKGLSYELYNLPADDPKTYKMIQAADTIGVFQIESRAQMSLLPRLKPQNYYDLVTQVAIVRPGPIQGGMIHPYLERRDGKVPITYAHEKLKPILEKTLGVPLFQEQIMQIVMAVADFSPGEADQMRRIMSNAWRKPSDLQDIKEKLYRGMRQNKIAEKYIEQIYKTLEGFASYGFPESHSASFALLTYASCYIKCHHPDVFLCALLNSAPLGFYSSRTLIQDAQKHQVKILPISIQHSKWDHVLENPGEVRLGYRALRGLQKRSMQSLLENRQSSGPFLNLQDFMIRTQPGLATAQILAKAGAFDDFNLSPRQALWQISSLSFDKNSFLFGTAAPELPLKNETHWQTLTREYAAKGFSENTHPLKLFRSEITQRNLAFQSRGHGIFYASSRDFAKHRDQDWIRTVGLLSIHQKPPTAKGVSFLTLEDEFGLINVVLMPKIYERYRMLLKEGPFFEIFGKLEIKSGVTNLMAKQVFKWTPPRSN